MVKVKTLNLLLMCVYRPPDSTVENFCESMNICQKAIDDVTEKDPKVKDILILGDFNLPCIIVGKKWDHRILDPLFFLGKIRKNTKS